MNSSAGSILLRSGRLILLVALITAAGGLIGALLRSARGDVYQAEVVVAASRTTLLADNFTELGVAVFRTDTVLRPVVDELDLDITPQTLLSEGHLQVESVSNAVALQIVAQDSDPQLAADLANASAESFAAALTENEMGTFAVFEDDEVTQTSGQTPLQSSLLAAALGVVLGAVILLLRNLLVQPILSQDEALREYPADLSFLARMRRLGASLTGRNRSDEAFEVLPAGLVSAINRATEHREGMRSPESCFVLVEKSRKGDDAVRALMHKLTRAASRADESSAPGPKWITSTDPKLASTLENSGVIIALVSAGVARRTLQLLTEELLVSPGRRLLVLVFVTGERRSAGLTGAWTAVRQLLARWWGSMRRQFSGSRSGGT